MSTPDPQAKQKQQLLEILERLAPKDEQNMVLTKPGHREIRDFIEGLNNPDAKVAEVVMENLKNALQESLDTFGGFLTNMAHKDKQSDVDDKIREAIAQIHTIQIEIQIERQQSLSAKAAAADSDDPFAVFAQAAAGTPGAVTTDQSLFDEEDADPVAGEEPPPLTPLKPPPAQDKPPPVGAGAPQGDAAAASTDEPFDDFASDAAPSGPFAAFIPTSPVASSPDVTVASRQRNVNFGDNEYKPGDKEAPLGRTPKAVQAEKDILKADENRKSVKQDFDDPLFTVEQAIADARQELKDLDEEEAALDQRMLDNPKTADPREVEYTSWGHEVTEHISDYEYSTYQSDIETRRAQVQSYLNELETRLGNERVEESATASAPEPTAEQSPADFAANIAALDAEVANAFAGFDTTTEEPDPFADVPASPTVASASAASAHAPVSDATEVEADPFAGAPTHLPSAAPEDPFASNQATKEDPFAPNQAAEKDNKAADMFAGFNSAVIGDAPFPPPVAAAAAAASVAGTTSTATAAPSDSSQSQLEVNAVERARKEKENAMLRTVSDTIDQVNTKTKALGIPFDPGDSIYLRALWDLHDGFVEEGRREDVTLDEILKKGFQYNYKMESMQRAEGNPEGLSFYKDVARYNGILDQMLLGESEYKKISGALGNLKKDPAKKEQVDKIEAAMKTIQKYKNKAMRDYLEGGSDSEKLAAKAEAELKTAYETIKDASARLLGLNAANAPTDMKDLAKERASHAEKLKSPDFQDPVPTRSRFREFIGIFTDSKALKSLRSSIQECNKNNDLARKSLAKIDDLMDKIKKYGADSPVGKHSYQELQAEMQNLRTLMEKRQKLEQKVSDNIGKAVTATASKTAVNVQQTGVKPEKPSSEVNAVQNHQLENVAGRLAAASASAETMMQQPHQGTATPAFAQQQAQASQESTVRVTAENVNQAKYDNFCKHPKVVQLVAANQIKVALEKDKLCVSGKEPARICEALQASGSELSSKGVTIEGKKPGKIMEFINAAQNGNPKIEITHVTCQGERTTLKDFLAKRELVSPPAPPEPAKSDSVEPQRPRQG